MPTVKSYGAAKGVTGSCHLLEIDGVKILIDCGMFQGEEEEANHQDFGFLPEQIDYLFLTHAHLDHIGRVPKLVKEGFKGKIYATNATMDLAYIVLLDSVKIMNEELESKYKKVVRRTEDTFFNKPLYAPIDVQKTFNQIEWINPDYDETTTLCENISFTFRNAGHILGAAFIEFTCKEDDELCSITFSGDIGNSNKIVLPDLQECVSTQNLYIESTYGDRNHRTIEETIKEFKEVVLATLKRNGNVLIPSFAIERTQEILCVLREMHENKELPPYTQIFLDSPMATKATDVYTNYVEDLSQTCQDNVKENGSVFDFEALKYTQSPLESKAINSIESNAIIIAGSGMCTGGRITHHFVRRIWNEKNSVIFVGYQAEGTIGRDIVDGAEWINLYGEDVIVKASIHTINGFSAHADQSRMLEWISNIKDLKKVFIVHGEKKAQEIFKNRIEKELHIDAHIVKYGQEINV